MSTDDATLTNLLAITGMDATTGAFYLESAGGLLERAVQLFFANAGGGNGNSFSTSSTSSTSSTRGVHSLCSPAGRICQTPPPKSASAEIFENPILKMPVFFY